MNTATKLEADSIEYCYVKQHMSCDQVAAQLGLSQCKIKKYLRERGIARNRKESTSKTVRTLRQKAANVH